MCRQRKKTHPPKESHNITKMKKLINFLFVLNHGRLERSEFQGSEGGRNGSNSPIRQWGVKGVGRAKMGQILQFVLNNGGSKGPVRAEQWGVKGVGGAKMGQILQFVLNNGGSKGWEGPKWVGWRASIEGVREINL